MDRSFDASLPGFAAGLRPSDILHRAAAAGFVAGAFFALALLGRAAEGGEIPEKVRRALEANAREISPVSAVWVRRNVVDGPNGVAADGLGVDAG